MSDKNDLNQNNMHTDAFIAVPLIKNVVLCSWARRNKTRYKNNKICAYYFLEHCIQALINICKANVIYFLVFMISVFINNAKYHLSASYI